MIIDTHGHMIPPDLLATIRKEGGKLSALRIVEDPAGLSLAFGNSKPSRPIMKGLSDLTGRLAWMDKQGIDKQVNGGWPDWFGSDLPPDQGERWCRLMNEGILSAARAEPRLVPLATLPMQDGARAGAVLKEAMAAGFRGAMISTLPRGIGSVLAAPDGTRHHRTHTVRASICHGNAGRRPCHARYRHAVSDRRPRADDDRQECRPEAGPGCSHQWRDRCQAVPHPMNQGDTMTTHF